MTSFTVSFTGTSSVLRADFFPEIVLDPNAHYSCALLDFTSYNSIPNITEGQNNEFQFKATLREKKRDKGRDIVIDKPLNVKISLPTGAYEVEDILSYLKSELSVHKISLTYAISDGSSTVQIEFDTKVEWIGGTVLNLIGFQGNSKTFESRWKYRSDHIVKITNIDLIRIECDIVSDSYINGKDSHTIHQFSSYKVSPGYKFIEVPRHLIYLPIKEKQLRSVQLSVVDQDGKLVDFRGEQISCRIHIRKESDY